MKPDKFKVDLVDYDNEIGLAFSQGEGESRVRWGARLDADMARRIASELNHAAGRIEKARLDWAQKNAGRVV